MQNHQVVLALLSNKIVKISSNKKFLLKNLPFICTQKKRSYFLYYYYNIIFNIIASVLFCEDYNPS